MMAFFYLSDTIHLHLIKLVTPVGPTRARLRAWDSITGFVIAFLPILLVHHQPD